MMTLSHVKLKLIHIRSFLLKSYIKAHSSNETINYDNLMIVAPHPDDESFACGGLISSSRINGRQVSVAFVTDGGASHQACNCNMPPRILGSIRRRLAVQADSILGVDESSLIWLDLRDGGIPDRHDKDFKMACNLLADSFQKINPCAVFAPHFMDVWPDHVATSHIVQNAISIYGKPVILYYYPVWLFFKTKFRYFSKIGQLRIINLNIADVIQNKDEAIKCYTREVNPVCGKPYVGKLPPGFVDLFKDSSEFYFTSP